MRTVELVLDDELDRVVRGVWQRLHAAGRKSLATHAGATNRPHLTLATGEELPPDVVTAVEGLPLPAVLDGIVLFTHAVAWRVAAGPELQRMQAAVAALTGYDRPWVPHVSLALRVREPEVYAPLLAGLDTARGSFVAARSYDTETKTVLNVGPPSPRPAP